MEISEGSIKIRFFYFSILKNCKILWNKVVFNNLIRPPFLEIDHTTGTGNDRKIWDAFRDLVSFA